MLEKKSSIYSSRPMIAVGGELVGWNRTLALLPYGNKFREYRRLIFQLIGSRKNMERFVPLVEAKTRAFVHELNQDPARLVKLIQKYGHRSLDTAPERVCLTFCSRCRSAGAIILMMSHGYQVQDKNDPFVATVDEAMEQFAICTAPGAFLANIFPARAFLTALSGSAGPPTDALALPQLLTSPLGSLVPVSGRLPLPGGGRSTSCATDPITLSSSRW